LRMVLATVLMAGILTGCNDEPNEPATSGGEGGAGLPDGLLLAAEPAGATGVVAQEQTFSLFDDLSLQHGFRLSAVRSTMKPVETGSVLVLDPAQAPNWRLAQWGTRFSLASVEEETLADGTRVLSNAGKTVKVFPGGLGGDGVLLAVNGGAEYDNALRKQGEPWPHLLVEYCFRTGLFLRDLSALNFQVEFRIEQCAPATDKPLASDLHTAQISAFWTIHNKNRESSDYNDMIWFGVPLFDARFDVPQGHQAVDSGKDDATGKFICTIAGERFWSGPVNDGQWHTLACDLLPLIREALALSQAKDFLTDSAFEDLSPTTFNLGWEVPGPYDCAIHLRALKLEGTPRE
jgi:hypothetical protein